MQIIKKFNNFMLNFIVWSFLFMLMDNIFFKWQNEKELDLVRL
jgi:hypothetical protein